MDINRMSDTELAKCLAEQIKFGNAVRFIRQCVKDSRKELVEAVKEHLKNMEGICSHMNQSEVSTRIYQEWLKLEQALASVEGKKGKK